MTLYFAVTQFNPNEEFLVFMRNINIMLAFLAIGVLWWVDVRKYWSNYPTHRKLKMLSLIFLCMSIGFGTLEFLYFKTEFRVIFITTGLLWAIIAATYPDKGGDMPKGS